MSNIWRNQLNYDGNNGGSTPIKTFFAILQYKMNHQWLQEEKHIKLIINGCKKKNI